MPATHSVPQDVLDLCSYADRVGSTIEHRVLLQTAALLPPDDQRLFLLALSGTHSVRQLAVLTGVHPGSLSRRIKRLRMRLQDPIVGALIDFGAELSELLRRVGLDHFLRGRPLAALARELALPRGEITAMAAYLRGWATRVPRAHPATAA